MTTPATSDVTSDKFQEEYKPGFVSKWDDLIDWERRAEGESEFFAKILRSHGCERVLDAACGTGFHAVTLAQEGFDVLAADGHEEMVAQTEVNARERGVKLAVAKADWRTLTDDIDSKFDAVICLGNAFTHLFSEEERVQSMGQFFDVLEPGGLAIIDQRNYDSILDLGFSSKHKYYYCGEDVEATPEEITDEYIRFQYVFGDGAVHHLTLFPIRQAALSKHMADAGFENVTRYGDFKPDFELHDPDFVVQVGEKPVTAK
ncbi:MAG: class I SAM-dependent methyltransferase [Egibacteraceae bacterium]